MPQPVETTAGTSEQQALLLSELQRLRTQSQLSFGRLAERTHYSRSSWERFLNGKRMPTRAAVEQLAAVVGEAPQGLLRLLEQVAAEGAAGPAPGGGTSLPTAAADEADRAPAAAGPPSGQPNSRVRESWWRRMAMTLCAVAGLLLGSLTTVLTGTGSRGSAPGSTAADVVLTPAAGHVEAGCSSDACAGRDPRATRCEGDAITARETWLRGVHVELRYSSACEAVWGRIENGTLGDSVTVRGPSGQRFEAVIRIDHDGYTRMLPVTEDAPPDTVTVCGTLSRQGQQACSPAGRGPGRW